MKLASGPLPWQDVAPAAVAPGIDARTLVGDHLSATVFELAAHAPIPRHAHPNEELGVVLRGGLRLECGGEVFTVTAGSSFFVPADAVHEGAALEDGCTLLECYAPPRVPAPAAEGVG